jgi:hypothetical protein
MRLSVVLAVNSYPPTIDKLLFPVPILDLKV